MNNWSVIGLLSCLCVASLAHATSITTPDARSLVRSPAQGHASTTGVAPSFVPRPQRRSGQRSFGVLTCSAPQLVRPDQGIGAYQDVPAAGGTFNLLVWGSRGCQWGLSEDADMLATLTPASGTGNVTVSYTVLPNTGAARTAVIKAVAAGDTTTFEVRQAAAATATPPPPATNSLSNDPSVLGAQHTCSNVPMTTVKSGATLKPDTYVLSPSRKFKLIYQTDGNLVLYRASGEFLWNNGKVNSGGRLVMQTDGNLVSYDSANKAIWATNTYKYPGAFLGVQDDGNVVVYAANSCKALWARSTAR